MTFDTNVGSSIPQRNESRGEATKLVREFKACGAPAARVNSDSGRPIFATYNSLFQAAKRVDGVAVIKRGDDIYLLRTDLPKEANADRGGVMP